jgi:hypothetical protein
MNEGENKLRDPAMSRFFARRHGQVAWEVLPNNKDFSATTNILGCLGICTL